MACNCCGLPCPFRAVKVDELVCAMFFPARDSETLRHEMDSLRNMRMGVEEMITNLGVGWVERADVRQWIDRVNCLDGEVLWIMELVNRHSACTRLLSCIVCFSCNYSLSEKIRNKLDAVRILKGEQQDRGGTSVEAVGRGVSRSLYGTISNLPGSRAEHPVNLDDNISEIVRHLKGTARCIGIYGMGGVGKTTLVMELVERLKSPNFPVQFDWVISVAVSQQTNIMKIQEDIGVQFGFVRDNDREGEHLPSNKDDRAKILKEQLSNKKFLLILDDVWERIDLADIGIDSWSESHPMSKILLTTRNEEVCRDMRCGNHAVFVKPLTEKDSWDLFCQYSSNDGVLWKPSADIHHIVEDVVRKCGGLPLLIITVARAMDGSTHVSEWQVAKERLDKCSPSDAIENMEDVIRILKFSFDYLKKDVHRSCMLFCAVYPEDYNIEINSLINYWIGEGLLDSFRCADDYEGLQGRGREIIKILRRASLLESGDGDDHVKMHDAIRDMTIWIGKQGGDYNGCKFLIKELLGQHQQVIINTIWWDGHRVLLDHQARTEVELVVVEEEEEIPAFKSIPLQTLILRSHDSFINVQESLFDSAANLQVLEMSHGHYHSSLDLSRSFHLPMSLFQLKSLKHLELSRLSLKHIPKEIGCLISLQFLNLSMNRLEEIPIELGKLINLVVLYLNSNLYLTFIPSAAISPLRKLQILNLHEVDCFYQIEEGALRIDDLRNLPGLRNVWLQIYDNEYVRQLLECHAVPRNSLGFLDIRYVDKLTTDELRDIVSKHSKKMKELWLWNCPGLGGRFQMDDCCQSLVCFSLFCIPLIRFEASTQWGSLEKLFVRDCASLESLPSLINFPNLRELEISKCNELLTLGPMEEDQVVASSLSGTQSRNRSLPKLESICLEFLPRMRCISSNILHMPSLSKTDIYDCPELKKLPIIPGNNYVRMKCDREWWERLVWDEEVPKERFEPVLFR